MNAKKRVNGSWVDAPDCIRKSHTDTDIITTLPATIIADGTNASVGLKGNMYQASGVSPTTPIQPQGTGERTGNLFSSIWEQGIVNGTTGQNEGSGTLVRTKDYIPIKPNVAYSFRRSIFKGYINLRLYRSDKSYIGSGSASTIRLISGTSVGNPMGNNTSFCCFEVIDSEVAYIRFNDSSNNTATKWLMFEGEYTQQTMPEYEPYGYKIPISSANTTTPVYLGEVETTRRIRKLVLTGEETEWQGQASSGGRNRFTLPILNAMQADTAHFTSLSTHLPLGVVGATWDTDDVYTIVSSKLYVRLTAQYDTLADFNAYLQQQYANGTPVTVWYVLATEETAVVNEPLRKIGDYADTVSYEQAGVQIPTLHGNTVVDVLTELKPSEVSLSYAGWHPLVGHKRINGAWT